MLALLLPLLASAAPIEELAREGDAAYRAGDYERAIRVYERVLASGYEGGPLEFNLANAHYKRGNLAPAILHYERAARLMPHNRDVRYNLELARSRTVDRIDEPPRLPVWRWLDAMRDMIAPRALASTAWVLALLAALAFGASLLVRPPLVRPLRIAAPVLAVLWLGAVGLIGLRMAHDHGSEAAIVMPDKVQVHSAPDTSSLEVFALHEGTRVTVVRELEGWREVRLADGRQGWVPRESCTVI